MGEAKPCKSFLLRFKKVDTINGVTSETFEKLCAHLEMNKTQTLHFALKRLAKDYGIIKTEEKI